MRTAYVVAVLGVACLLAPAHASPFTKARETMRNSRAAQAMPPPSSNVTEACRNALQAVVSCNGVYPFHGDNLNIPDEMRYANALQCCGTMGNAKGACAGGDLAEFMVTVLNEGDYIVGFNGTQTVFDLVGSCPNGNNETCTAAMINMSNCFSSNGWLSGVCCGTVQQVTPVCLGNTRNNDFFETLGFSASMSGCAPFSADMCTAAVGRLSRCTAGDGVFGGFPTCCKQAEFVGMFCMNHANETAFDNSAQAETLTTLVRQCDAYHGGGGGGGSHQGSGSGGGYNMCDYGAFAPGIFWYNGNAVTSRMDLAGPYPSVALSHHGMNYYIVDPSRLNVWSAGLQPATCGPYAYGPYGP